MGSVGISITELTEGVLRSFFPYQILILLLLHVVGKVLHGVGFFVLWSSEFALL